jgi:hypothetical protein
MIGNKPDRQGKDLEPFDSKSLVHMVRLAGIEPTTPWFVAKYSIQLSYSRYMENYNMPVVVLMTGHHTACCPNQGISTFGLPVIQGLLQCIELLCRQPTIRRA